MFDDDEKKIWALGNESGILGVSMSMTSRVRIL